MHLGRVIGRVVATQRYEGLEGVTLQWVEPIGEDGQPEGAPLVATTAISVGPGDFVTWVDGREAAMTCPRPFVPVDAAVVGFVSQAVRLGQDIEPAPLKEQR